MSYNDSLLPGVKNSYCSSWSLSCPCLWIQEEKEGESICSSLSQLIISLSLSFQPHKPFPSSSSSLILVSHWFSLSFFVIITKNHRMEGKRMKESKELLRLPLSFPSFILPLKFLLHLLFTHHLSQFLFRFFSINSVLHHQSLFLKILTFFSIFFGDNLISLRGSSFNEIDLQVTYFAIRLSHLKVSHKFSDFFPLLLPLLPLKPTKRTVAHTKRKCIFLFILFLLFNHLCSFFDDTDCIYYSYTIHSALILYKRWRSERMQIHQTKSQSNSQIHPSKQRKKYILSHL